jgi:hypothetical protein
MAIPAICKIRRDLLFYIWQSNRKGYAESRMNSCWERMEAKCIIGTTAWGRPWNMKRGWRVRAHSHPSP